jgi:hypothetical protein
MQDMGRNRKASNARRDEVLSTRVNAEIYHQVLELCKRKELTVAQIVRGAVRNYLRGKLRHAA